MCIAILSDIHANREAFTGCLAATELAGADWVFGGGIGICPSP